MRKIFLCVTCRSDVFSAFLREEVREICSHMEAHGDEIYPSFLFGLQRERLSQQQLLTLRLECDRIISWYEEIWFYGGGVSESMRELAEFAIKNKYLIGNLNHKSSPGYRFIEWRESLLSVNRARVIAYKNKKALEAQIQNSYSYMLR